MASISELLYEAGGNLARPSTYSTMLTLPETVGNILDGNNYDVLCKNISIPPSKAEIIDFKFKGHSVPLPGRTTTDHVVSVTFILDEAHNLKLDLDRWIKGLDKYSYNYAGTEKNDENIQDMQGELITDKLGYLVIGIKDWDGQEVGQYEFTDIFPISVSGPEFDTSGVSTVLEITVEFAFFKLLQTSMPESSFFNDLLDDGLGYIKGKLSAIGDDIKDSITEEAKTTSSEIDVQVPKPIKDFFGDSFND